MKLVFRFRFISSDLLAEILERDRSTVYESLYVLEKQGYLHKIYDSSYRLQQIPARYTLAGKGIKYLLAQKWGSTSQLQYFYRNRSEKPEHMAHSLEVVGVYNALKQQAGKTFTVYSGSEIANNPAFLRPLSDLYLERVEQNDEQPDAFLLEVIDPHRPFWFYRSRLKAHQKHYNEDWPYNDYPTVLMVAPDYRTERYMLRMVARRGFDYEVWVTNKQRLTESRDGKVWATEFEDPEDMEFVTL